MSSDHKPLPVISVEGLSKKYRVGTAVRSTTIKETLTSIFKSARRKSASLKDATESEFWALRDLSFEVQAGDRLGVIGRNGAGKSTLLKIISRITEPTTGRITVEGRVAALLEVGTGFHPELTGRENIYLNGAVLGMSKQEIARKYDEIVEFAGVEPFIHTPIKRYSSGMRVRLAFSVAAHLEPEILIIDEVLAVGDTVFQRKCMERMLQVSRQGRTIVFVSHNLAALRTLCHRAIVLDSGRMVYSGPVEEAIDHYCDGAMATGPVVELTDAPRLGTSRDLVFRRIHFPGHPYRFGDKLTFAVQVEARAPRSDYDELEIAFTIRDLHQTTLVHGSNKFINVPLTYRSEEDQYLFEVDHDLRPGQYFLTLFLRCGDQVQDWIVDQISFEIMDGNPYGYHDSSQIRGAIFPPFSVRVHCPTEPT